MGAGRQTIDQAVLQGFGSVLRKLRQERGLTQEQLAEKSRASRMFVSFLETGKQSCTMPKLFELARALNVAPAEMVAAVDEEVRKAEDRTAETG
jgi:transcriptional regulator with XRE-family HTH domain